MSTTRLKRDKLAESLPPRLATFARFTGSPSKLTEDDVRKMATTLGLFEQEIEAAIRGLRESQKETE